MSRPMPEKTVVVDATVIIHLANAQCLNLLGALKGYEFVVPDQVVEEITRPQQAAALERAVRAGWLRRESSTEPVEIALYGELRARMGKGEAACLAMAATRGWMLASDDRGRAFRRLAREYVGQERLLDTPGIAAAARAEGVLSDADAQRIQDSVRR